VDNFSATLSQADKIIFGKYMFIYAIIYLFFDKIKECFGRAAARTKKQQHSVECCCFFCGLRRAIRGSLRSYLRAARSVRATRTRGALRRAATIPLAQGFALLTNSDIFIFLFVRRETR
jgi:hypothetical protein